MFKITHFSILILVLFLLLPFVVSAGNYLDGALLRTEGDIKVYLINNNIKRWVSSIEVFNLNNFKWQNVKIISKKEISALKEGDPILLEPIFPSPVSSAIPIAPIASISPVPSISASALPEALARQAKINPKFPALDYLRADWLISHITSNYGRIGQRIVFKYSDKKADKIENFRLYEKKPGDEYFVRVATFEEVPSTGCEDIDIDGEWMMTEAGQCGYWSIQKIVPSTRLPDGQGGRGMVAYLPATNYLAGEYSYYVAGADKDGLETRPSPESKLIFLSTINISSPADKQQMVGVYPVFKWSISNGWPASPDYFISISDNEAAQNPLWAKQIKVQESRFEESLTYDGSGLDPTKKYKINIYGHYRKSEYDPDYISIPFTVPEFSIKSISSVISFSGLLKALFLNPFDFLR